jgi:hypothetical protein
MSDTSKPLETSDPKTSPDWPFVIEEYLRHYVPLLVERREVTIVTATLPNKKPLGENPARAIKLVYEEMEGSPYMNLIAAFDPAWGYPDNHLYVDPPPNTPRPNGSRA